jgi:uncharacterized protein
MMQRWSLSAHLDGLRRGELLISACGRCGASDFPPRTQCGLCADTEIPSWTQCDGSGWLWSFAAFHRPYLPEFYLPTPYVVAVIELDEGVRLYGNVVGLPMSVLRVGQPVRANFSAIAEGGPHLTFTADERQVS